MCICGFVCVPLIAWGIGVLGIAGGAGIAEVERAKSAEAEGKGGEGDCGNGEALQELCGTASAASTAGSNGGALLAVVETPKSAEGMCFLCYGMQHECGCESLSTRVKSASEAEGTGGEGEGGSGEALQQLRGTSSAPPNGGALLAEINTPKSSEGMCFLCYGMQHECGCESQGQGELGDEAESSSEANC